MAGAIILLGVILFWLFIIYAIMLNGENRHYIHPGDKPDDEETNEN
jgi:hypothetical protein